MVRPAFLYLTLICGVGTGVIIFVMACLWLAAMLFVFADSQSGVRVRKYTQGVVVYVDPPEIVDLKFRLADQQQELWNLAIGLHHSEEIMRRGRRAYRDSRLLLERLRTREERGIIHPILERVSALTL